MTADTLAGACRERAFSFTDADAIVTDNPDHIGYLCGYRSILHDMAPYRQLLVATRGRSALVTGASDAGAAQEVVGESCRIWRYGTFFVYGDEDSVATPPAHADFGDAVLAALESELPDKGSILIDLDRADTMAIVAQTLSNWRRLPAASVLARSRAVKLSGELDRLRHASRATDAAIASASRMIRPGVTELELAAEISRMIVGEGGVPRFVVVTSGERSSLVDAFATERRIEQGDIVRIDVGGRFSGYHSDMARSFCCGEPEPLAEQRYDALLDGEQAELNLIRPGASAHDIFEAAVAAVRKGGIPDYRRNHCGHGIGIASHEFPYIASGNETELEAGMALCLETPYYERGWGGMMVEDTVIVTNDGYERITPSSRALRQIASV
ncbi:Xaa-Pro peptidase family protein [Hoeflea sp. WL0058]|uniref:Xaa-Pro peptidase family protein n=1 Tax=Flavimaribacter sediminis TaxID=2865987 RepID=A0AAE2ZL93_9HYPH|nr:Xaa-Pro peptidase family protein [Flavimaribacter sediminis]MBW8636732.1 Xaa-Pro peptidase family protein [Flavimaribacter sediminis]